MKEADRKKRNTDRLLHLHAPFRVRIERIIKVLEEGGLRPRIQDGWRSPEAQLAAYNGGYSKLKFGFHNCVSKTGDPEGLAVDMLDDDAPLAPRRPYLLRLAAAAEAEGLQTGIRWGVPAALRSAIDQAIATGDWDAVVKIGWDPTHVEPVGITPRQAQKKISAGQHALS